MTTSLLTKSCGDSEVVAKLLEGGADVGVKTWARKAFVME